MLFVICYLGDGGATFGAAVFGGAEVVAAGLAEAEVGAFFADTCAVGAEGEEGGEDGGEEDEEPVGDEDGGHGVGVSKQSIDPVDGAGQAEAEPESVGGVHSREAGDGGPMEALRRDVPQGLGGMGAHVRQKERGAGPAGFKDGGAEAGVVANEGIAVLEEIVAPESAYGHGDEGEAEDQGDEREENEDAAEHGGDGWTQEGGMSSAGSGMPSGAIPLLVYRNCGNLDLL